MKSHFIVASDICLVTYASRMNYGKSRKMLPVLGVVSHIFGNNVFVFSALFLTDLLNVICTPSIFLFASILCDLYGSNSRSR